MTCALTVSTSINEVCFFLFFLLIVVGIGELSPYVLNEGFSNYPSPFAKKRTSTSGFRAPGPRDGIKPPRLCLGCRAVWVQGPPELCNSCGYFH